MYVKMCLELFTREENTCLIVTHDNATLTSLYVRYAAYFREGYK